MAWHGLIFAFAFLIGLAAVWAQPSSASARASLSAEGKADLSRQLNDSIQRGDAPGVVAAVIDRDGLLFESAAGYQNEAKKIPMAVDTIFSIASMTKPVTSVAVMTLVEQNKIGLDDPVSKYLPGFDHLVVMTNFNEKTGAYQTRPAKRPLTIRHLLTHTAGFGYPFCNPVETQLTKSSKKNEWELPLLANPGERWIYSPSTRLLGNIVEKVTGKSLEEFFQERIFRPLGMKDTSFAVAASKQSRVVTMHQRTNGKFQEQQRNKLLAEPKPPFFGDGGLYSTAPDYARFVQMLLSGGGAGSGRVMSEESVKKMGENNIGAIVVETQPAMDPTFAKPFPLGAGHDKFGLGFQLTAKDDRYREYRSPGSMSWAGIFNTEFWVDPVKHIGAVQLLQTLPFYDDGAIRTLRDFEKAVYRNLAGSSPK